jgi:hypothetical protein
MTRRRLTPEILLLVLMMLASLITLVNAQTTPLIHACVDKSTI